MKMIERATDLHPSECSTISWEKAGTRIWRTNNANDGSTRGILGILIVKFPIYFGSARNGMQRYIDRALLIGYRSRYICTWYARDSTRHIKEECAAFCGGCKSRKLPAMKINLGLLKLPRAANKLVRRINLFLHFFVEYIIQYTRYCYAIPAYKKA